jgi:SET domain-containing protein
MASRHVEEDLIEVRRSRIQGRGVYAARPIRRGTRIIEYTGEVLTEKQLDARYKDDAADDPRTYLFQVDENRFVDATVTGNEARFINHSCKPNCEVEIRRRRIYIVALRNIKTGEELSYDYALEIEEDPSAERLTQFPCRCGSRGCRGTMLDLDE